MECKNIIEGLNIINNNKPKSENEYHVRAEHDEIIAGSLEWPMGDKDKNKLEELGWVPIEEYDGWRAMV